VAAHALTHPPEWAAAMLFPSLVFGYFRDRYRSVVPAAALHVFYNAGWFLLRGA
jgi:membrane protease YdiL (CAAX protease family)